MVDTRSDRCLNWMNFDRIRQTVSEYESLHGAPDGSTNCDNLTELSLTKNCSECNMRPQFTGVIEELMQVCGMFKDPIMVKLEEAGMKRKCYKADTK